jgi:formate dehydrogenase subunit delta
MEIDTLIHMANRIGAFFEAQPDRDEGLDGVAEHLRRYWEPRMRRSLLAHVDGAASPAAGAETLSPFVREAIERHRVGLTPDSQPAAA